VENSGSVSRCLFIHYISGFVQIRIILPKSGFEVRSLRICNEHQDPHLCSDKQARQQSCESVFIKDGSGSSISNAPKASLGHQKDLRPCLLCTGTQCCGSEMIIPDPNFSIPDPGSKRFRILDPDPHLRIQVFLSLKTVSKISENYLGCSSRIRIFRHPGTRIRMQG
jgi:hypothetical protein